MNTRTGEWKDLYSGELIAIVPDGKHCAVAPSDWIGPYKRGGDRLGALVIVDIAIQKGTPVTSELMDISGGDWRKSKMESTIKRGS